MYMGKSYSIVNCEDKTTQMEVPLYILPLKSGLFLIIKWQKKSFTFLFLLELFFQRMYFSLHWVLDYQMLMHIL